MPELGAFVLPEEVGKLVRGGMELGEADDVVFKQSNSKQKSGLYFFLVVCLFVCLFVWFVNNLVSFFQGAVGILTNNTLTRTTYYEQGNFLVFYFLYFFICFLIFYSFQLLFFL